MCWRSIELSTTWRLSTRARAACSNCDTSEDCRSRRRATSCASPRPPSRASGGWQKRGSVARSRGADDMDPNRWRLIDDLFQAALDCEPAARAELLDASCEGDAALRAEVESLIEAHGDGGFTSEGHEFESVLEAYAAQAAAGRRIGAYRVEREIGHGGMRSEGRRVG